MPTIIINVSGSNLILPAGLPKSELKPNEGMVVADPLGPVLANVSGLSVEALPAAGGDIAVTGTVNVYVDVTNGNDNNSGESASSALKTIPAVYTRFPLEAFEDAIIRVNLLGTGTTGQATYEAKTVHIGSNRALTTNYSYVGPAMIAVVPTTGLATGVLDTVPATRVDVAGDAPGLGLIRTRLNVADSPGWTTNDFKGAFVRITRGGALVVPELPISRNAAGSITVDRLDVFGEVLEDDVVTIVRPAVVITGPAGDFGAFLVRGGYGNLTDFGLPSTASFTRCELTGAMPVLFGGCSFDRCTLSSFVQGYGGSPSFGNCCVIGPLIWDGARIGFGSFTPAGTFLSPGKGEILFSAFDGGLTLRGCTARIGRPMAVWDSPADAVTLTEGSDIYVGTASLGTANVGVGYKLSTANCSLRINGGDSTQLLGTAGDLKLSTGAAIAYGTGAGEFEEALGYNGNFTRVLEGTAAAPTGDASRIYVD